MEHMRSARLREKAGLPAERFVKLSFVLFSSYSNVCRCCREDKEEVDIVGDDDESKPAVNGSKAKFVINASSKSGTQTPKEDEAWELDCEICHRRGTNLVCIIVIFLIMLS